MTTENYVYKKEVDWSLLQEGLTLPFDNQVIFGQVMGRFLNRGESKDITLYLNGKSYKAQIRNVNFDPKFKRKKDTLHDILRMVNLQRRCRHTFQRAISL